MGIRNWSVNRIIEIKKTQGITMAETSFVKLDGFH